MYNTKGIVPAKFLCLFCHLAVCVILLWNSTESSNNCLPMEYAEEVSNYHHLQLVVGLSLALAMICFELLTFLTGVTMFDSTSALLSIACHASASILLTYMILDQWCCIWFWWIFAFCSLLPAINDVFVVLDAFINGKY